MLNSLAATAPLPPPSLLSGRDGSPVVLHSRVVTGTGGGPEKTIMNSPRFLTAHGYQAVCAYMHSPGCPGFAELRRRADALQAPLDSVPDYGPWDLGVVRRMLAICRREQVAIWHAHDYKSNALGLLLRRFWPMRLVTTVHGWVVRTRRTPVYYWIDRRCLRRYERVICVSEDLVNTCLAAGVPPERCLHVPNAIDSELYQRRLPPVEARERLGLPRDGLLLGAVGRLSAEKGFDLLIRAVGQLIREGHDVRLIIVGEGDQRGSLETLVAAQPQPDRFRLLGYRSDAIELYQAMDVFALSSLREGLPNVLLEAMAMRVPVVATRVAGVPRLVRDGETGLLINPGDVPQLTDALRRVLAAAPLRRRLAEQGRAMVEQRYSFAARMARISDIYTDLLAGHTDR